MFANLELELAVLHPQEEAGAAAEVQMGATLKSEKIDWSLGYSLLQLD